MTASALPQEKASTVRKDILLDAAKIAADTVRSIQVLRALEQAWARPHLDFWCIIYGNMFDAAAIHWCKLFGSPGSNRAHWKNIVADSR